MPFSLADYDFKHRFIILVDIVNFSELTDEQEIELLKIINTELINYLNQGGWQKEKLFISFIPTGDGFYLLGDLINSLFWGQTFIFFILSFRNSLLKRLQAINSPCNGIKIAIHFGRTLEFKDINNNTNYTGSGMNNCARLLSPINSNDINHLRNKFYTHQNSVIVSYAAREKLGKIEGLKFRESNKFEILAKHGQNFECIFIDIPLEHEINI